MTDDKVIIWDSGEPEEMWRLVKAGKKVRIPVKNGMICYEITFSDGFIDFVPISDVEVGAHEIHAAKEVKEE